MARMRRTKRSDRQKAKTKAQATRVSKKSTGDGRSAHLKKEASKTRKDKIHDIEQSVGSLDRRINKAIESGDLDQAKDLRSRQNKFTTKLGLERAIESGGVLRDKEGRIVRSTRTGQPIMTGGGQEIFDQTKDMDFIDPTRRIQNVAGKAYSKMYPISSRIQEGPLVYQGLKGLFDKGEKRKIPYTDERMPGERYPLDEIIKEEEPFYGGRSLLDEESSLDDIIKRYTPPKGEVPTDPDLEEQWPPSPFEPIDPNQEVVDEFGLSTTVPKEGL